MKQKKGVLLELIIAIMIIVVFGMVLLIMKHVNTELVTVFNESDVITETGINNTQPVSTSINVLDGMTILIIIGLCIVVIVTSFFIMSHPVFFVVNIILLPVLIILSMGFSNAFDELANVDELKSTADSMVFTPFFMTKLPLFAVVISIIIMVVMYAKNKLVV